MSKRQHLTCFMRHSPFPERETLHLEEPSTHLSNSAFLCHNLMDGILLGTNSKPVSRQKRRSCPNLHLMYKKWGLAYLLPSPGPLERRRNIGSGALNRIENQMLSPAVGGEYSKMSNNVLAEIKSLQDVSATHLGHYETFLYGLVGTILGHYETFFQDRNRAFCQRWNFFPLGALRTVFLSPRVTWVLVFFCFSLPPWC